MQNRDAILAAIAWLARVAASHAPPHLRNLLSTREAADVLSSARWLVENTRELLASIRQGVLRLRTEFGAAASVFAEAPQEISSKAEELLARGAELPDYLELRELRQALDSDGLAVFLKRADELSLEYRLMPAVFDHLVTQRRAKAGPARESAAGACRRCDTRKLADAPSRSMIAPSWRTTGPCHAKLLERRPEPGSNQGRRTTWTEMALLRNEFAKQRRFTPVRGCSAAPRDRSRR